MLNNLRDRVGKINDKNGFSDDGKMPMAYYAGLILTELGEMVDADRKSQFTKLEEFKERLECLDGSINTSILSEDEIENLKNEHFKKCYKQYLKDTRDMELVGTIVRCLDTANRLNIDLDTLMELELKNNSLREFKHNKNY